LERCSTNELYQDHRENCKILTKMEAMVRKTSKEMKKYVINIRSQLGLILRRILMVMMRISESLLLIPERLLKKGRRTVMSLPLLHGVSRK
jgi:hypothetical protein